jgi:hypothetical protein
VRVAICRPNHRSGIRLAPVTTTSRRRMRNRRPKCLRRCRNQLRLRPAVRAPMTSRCRGR